MHRDPTLRKRNALVIPGALLVLFSLVGIVYATLLRSDDVSCGDGGLIEFAYACRRAWMLLLAPVIIGIGLIVLGAMTRPKSPCHIGHGTAATTGLALLIAGVAVPALAAIGLYAMEDPAAPYVMNYDGVDYGQVAVLTGITLVMLLALIPYLILYICTARPPKCCRDKSCFEPCFCDEEEESEEPPAPEAPQEPDNAFVVDTPWTGPTGGAPQPAMPPAQPPAPTPPPAPVVQAAPQGEEPPLESPMPEEPAEQPWAEPEAPEPVRTAPVRAKPAAAKPKSVKAKSAGAKKTRKVARTKST